MCSLSIDAFGVLTQHIDALWHVNEVDYSVPIYGTKKNIGKIILNETAFTITIIGYTFLFS